MTKDELRLKAAQAMSVTRCTCWLSDNTLPEWKCRKCGKPRAHKCILCDREPIIVDVLGPNEVSIEFGCEVCGVSACAETSYRAIQRWNKLTEAIAKGKQLRRQPPKHKERAT